MQVEPISLKKALQVQRRLGPRVALVVHLHRNHENLPRGPGQYQNFQNSTSVTTSVRTKVLPMKYFRNFEGGAAPKSLRSTVMLGELCELTTDMLYKHQPGAAKLLAPSARLEKTCSCRACPPG